jgi:hypothetical protein
MEGKLMQNSLDKKLYRDAYALFTVKGFTIDQIEWNIKELQILVERGYNTRAELIALIKAAN